MSSVVSNWNDQGRRKLNNPTSYEPFHEKATTDPITETHGGPHGLSEQPMLLLPIQKFDPLHVLPPELAVQCLLASLTSDSYFYSPLYASAVFELASVSTRWQYFVFSRQAFWQEIHLMPESHDLFATVSIFVHFSNTGPLDIIVWGDVRPELPAIRSILLPCKNRIHRLTFRAMTQIGRSREEITSWCVPTAAQITGSLGSLSNLRELDFGPNIQLKHSHIRSLFLPSTACITSPLDLSPLMEDTGQIELQRIAYINTSSHIDNLVPVFASLKNLKRLSLHRTFETPPSIIPALTTAPSSLKYIFHDQDYCGNLRKLICLVSSQLTYLYLKVPLSKLEELVENLKSLVCLNELALGLTKWSEMVPSITATSNITITSLHTMEIRSIGYVGLAGGYNPQPIEWLFETFKTLYPMVKRISFRRRPEIILQFANQYLESLQFLERLGPDLDSPHRAILLPSLHSLNCSLRGLAYFDAPNLLSLEVTSFTQAPIVGCLRMPNLRKLVVRTRRNDNVNLEFDGSKFPNLHELDIRMLSLNHRWKLSSFPQLSSITLNERAHLSTHGTCLCVSLIYTPEICPSLKHLCFSSFVSWDILFLMLQRRNCEAKGVSKIGSLNQKYVPPILLAPLSALLEGTSVNVLGNDDLRMEATREVICDPSIPGCILCLKTMRPSCIATVKNQESSGYSLFNEFSLQLESPPLAIPTKIREWFEQYSELAEKWEISFTDFQLRYYREVDCTRPRF